MPEFRPFSGELFAHRRARFEAAKSSSERGVAGCMILLQTEGPLAASKCMSALSSVGAPDMIRGSQLAPGGRH